jgi:opacity protein-like surface antigen
MPALTRARVAWTVAVVAVAVLVMPASARADGLITPFFGYNFGGSAGDCSSNPSCSTTQYTYGVAFGFMAGGLFGIEEDIAYAPHFFGSASDRSDNYVFTAMTNLLVGIPAGPVRPYALGGIGLIHTNVSQSSIGLYNAFSDNSIGFDAGGGLMVIFSTHVGVRGDLRYNRTFSSLTFSQFGINGKALDFWRGYGGVVFRF